MKRKLKALLSSVLSISLISQIIAIPVSAAIGNENISFENNYVIFANDIRINDFKADIESSVYAADSFEFTGTRDCTISDTLNSAEIKGNRISADKTINVDEIMPDYSMPLDEEVYYKTIYDSDTFISGTEYDLNSSMFVDGTLFLDQVILKNKGYIKASDSIKFNALNNVNNDWSVFMYSENGNITVQGSALVINGILYAPNGKVELNAKKLTINGMIIADKVEFNGSELYINQINKNDYPSFKPDIDIKISGEQKENRKISLDISGSEDFERIIKDKTVWEITSVDGSSDLIHVDEDSSDRSHKNLIVKKSGEYAAKVTVFTDKKSYIYEKSFTISEDIPPIAGIYADNTYYRTTEGNEAVITASDISYSSDLDNIGSRTWSLFFDSDNDGSFEDEEEIIVSNNNTKSFTYNVSHVGRYKIKLNVKEHFDNTIERFVSSEDYLTGTIEKVVTVDNKPPKTALEITKAKNIDLVFTVGTADTEKINLYTQKISEIKSNLENKGYNVTVSTVETSSLTAQDSFAWTEYDHINYADIFDLDMEKHILYQDNNIVMIGYGWEPLKDFLFVEDNDPSQKIFSFDIQRDNTDWHTMEGGGFLFNSSIDNGLLTGYCILLTQQGLKLIHLSGINVDNMRNGSPSILQNGGEVLTAADIGNVYDNHSLKIIVDTKSISVWDNDNVVIDNFILNDEITGYGYGPITSHDSHYCSQQSYFTFGNIKMETVKGNSLSDVLNNHKWNSKDNRYVINFSDSLVQDLRTKEKTAETAKAVIEKDIRFIGLGNAESVPQYSELLKSVSGVCFENENTDTAAENIENYILTNVTNHDYSLGQYITTEDILSYNDNYSDPENDPKSKSLYSYQYDPAIFESGEGTDIRNIKTNDPITVFESTGLYEISVKVKDNPTDNDKFNEYAKWSDNVSFDKNITVHTLPSAVMNTNVFVNSKNTEKAVVKVSEDSFDADHISEDTKGISAKSYSWKRISDTEWTEGIIPEEIEAGEVYLLKLIVTDEEEAISRPCICVISSEKVNTDFKDDEKPEISLVLSASQIEYGDNLAIGVSVRDNICVASVEVYVDNELLSDVQGSFIINGGSEGDHVIKVIAEDIFGNQAIEEQTYTVIDNRDKTGPQIIITSPEDSTKASSKLEIIGSVYDETELDYYKVEYALQGNDLVTAAYSTEPVFNNTLATLDIDVKKDNIYIIKITAADKSGNVTYQTITYTISEDSYTHDEDDTIPPVILLSTDKSTAEVGETVTVTIEVSDNKGISSVEVYKDRELVLTTPGKVEFSEAEAGTVTFRVVAKDVNDNTNQKEIKISIFDNTDNEKPTVAITYPKENEVITGNVVFIGSVKDNDSIAQYSLMYQKKDENSFSVFAQGNSDRNNDILGELDTTALDNGIYTIRLLAVDLTGNQNYTDVTVEISNEKIITPDYERPFIILKSNVDNNGFAGVNNPVWFETEVSDNQKVQCVIVTVNGEEIVPVNGIYSFEPNKTGIYRIDATVADESGNEGYCQYTIHVVDPEKQSTVECEITQPISGNTDIDEDNSITDNRAIIEDITEIKGTAFSDEFVGYELSYASSDSDVYTKFAESTTPVKDGVLGKFDPTTLENGIYNIRLRVYTESNLYSQYSVLVNVEGKNKIGNYSFSFADITLPVYTLPFSVSRTYNSMSRNNSGDFGYGWKMDISNIKIELSHSFSSGWNVSSSGGFMPVYSLKDISGHTVTITYPNNTTETFYLSLSPKASSFVPISYIDSYNLIGDMETESALEIIDKYDNLMFDGRYNLFDTNAKMFEPKNFKLTTKQGIVYILNVDTGVKSITDKQGNVLTFNKDGITHSDGKSIVFERDENNRITRITDPTGRSVVYQYDSYGDLIAVTDRNGNTVHFIYGREHDLIDIIDPNGTKAVRNEYDDSGRLISSTDANGNCISYSYDIANRFETVIDEFGDQTVYGYDKHGNVVSVKDCSGNTITFEYDEKGNKLKETDKQGNSVSYTYDDNGNITSITDALGNSRKMKYSSTNQIMELMSDSQTLLKYTYDKYDYITSVTDESGNVQKFEYDGRGALAKLSDSIGTLQSIEYDDSGNISSTTMASGSVENYAYDESGNCISKTIVSTDGSTKTEFYTYDGNGNLIRVKDNLGNESYGVYDACGQLVSSTDRLGSTITYEYDLLGNTTKITYPDHTTEKFTYDIVGRLLTSENRAGNITEYTYDKFGNTVSEKYANGAEVKYEYDLAGNVTKMTMPNGGVTTYEYDSLYRNTAVVDAIGNRAEYTYDKNSNVTEMKDPKGNIFKFEYDLAGNCTKVIYPDGTSTSSEYDVRGRLTAFVDQIGSRTEYSYDNANKLIAVKDALGNITAYTYSSNGELLSVTDANGNKTAYLYDTQCRLIKTLLPDGESTSMTYDKEGRVVSSTDANGVVSRFEYDAAGNITKQTVGNDVTAYTYTANGLIESVTNGADCTKYSYNNLNQLVKKTLQDGTEIVYTYDISGNITNISTPYTSTSYSYDKLNRIVRVVDHNGKATLYEYDANGNRSAVRYANGIVASYTYDSLNRLIKEKIADKNGNNIAVYEYTLDKNGNRIKAVENGKETSYSYDKLNRLVKETTTRAVTSYTYDRVGNRLTKTVDNLKTEYIYNSRNQLTKEVTNGVATVYTYDKNGSLLKQTNGTDTNLYRYDDYGRLISAKVTKDGKTTTDAYIYDVEGNRLTKTTDGKLTKYIVDSNGLSQVLAELDSSDKVIAEYTHGIEIVSQTRSNITHYYLFDGNGNVRMLTDSEGAVSDTYDYDAFGTATAEAGLTVNPYRYCGEYQDETTGLYYLRARYYDSTTGRFISADSYSGTLSDPVSLHKYLYANANPIMNSDPTGYFTLAGMSGAISVENILRNAYISSIVGGFLSFFDALVGGEKDAAALMDSFKQGAISGAVAGAFFSSVAAFGNINCVTSLTTKLFLGTASAYFGVEGAQGAAQSFKEGKIIQGIYRMILSLISFVGAGKSYGEALKTADAINNGATCFVAGTLVLTEDGEKPIESIKVGDYVYSTDPETGESDYKEVLQTFINESSELVHIHVNGEEIVSTPTHPFYSPVRGWTSAVDLRAGDILVLSNGEYVVVEQVQHEILEAPVKVYNFEVQDFHTYYVGKNSVLVHNKCTRPEVQRKKWEEYTGTQATGEVHHGLPEEFSDWFAASGRNIDVNSGEFYYDLPKDVHRLRRRNGIHTKKSPLGENWNSIWRDYIAENPYATRDDVLYQLWLMEKGSGISMYRATPKT